MGFLSGRGAASFVDSFLRSYESVSKQQREQEEDDRKKAQLAATSGFLSKLPGFKDMGDMTNVDPTTAYLIYNHQEALRAKQAEIDRKKLEAENTRSFYNKMMPGMIPQDAQLDGVDLGTLKTIYEAQQKNKQLTQEQQNRIALENIRFGNDARLKGMPTYSDTHQPQGETAGPFGGKDIKSASANIAMQLQNKIDSGQPLTKQEEALRNIVKSQLDEARQLPDGSVVSVSPKLSVFAGGGKESQAGNIDTIAPAYGPGVVNKAQIDDYQKAAENLRSTIKITADLADKSKNSKFFSLEDRGSFNANQSLALTNIKELMKLGVINGPDMKIISPTIPGPYDVTGMAMGDAVRDKVYKEQIKNMMTNFERINAKLNGQYNEEVNAFKAMYGKYLEDDKKQDGSSGKSKQSSDLGGVNIRWGN